MSQLVEDSIMGKMVVFKDGINQIELSNYALDFKKSYAFLGFTKNKNKVILGDIYLFGATNQDGTRKIKYTKKYGKIEYKVRSKPIYVLGTDSKYSFVRNEQYGEWVLTTDGDRFSEVILTEKHL